MTKFSDWDGCLGLLTLSDLASHGSKWRIRGDHKILHGTLAYSENISDRNPGLVEARYYLVVHHC